MSKKIICIDINLRIESGEGIRNKYLSDLKNKIKNTNLFHLTIIKRKL